MKLNSCLPPERLEDRIAPAGIVAVAYNSTTGALSLTGDDLDNSVDIVQTGVDAYRISGLDTTKLAGGGAPVALLDIGKLTSLTINGNAGADDFGLTGLTALKFLKFDGGAGQDFLHATNLAVKGDATLNLGAGSGLVAFDGASTSIGGDFKVTYGSGGGLVDFFATTTTIKGSVTLAGGTDFDTFSLGGVVSVEKGMMITDAGLGMGVLFQKATATIGKGRGGDSVDFRGGSGEDSLKIVEGNVTLKGDLEFSGGAGADTVDLNAASLKIDGRVSLDGGMDADVLKIAGAQVTLGRGVFLSGGGGADELTLSGDSLTIGGDVVVFGGDGDDTMNVLSKNLTLSGSLAVLGGGGANVSSVFADGSVRGSVYLNMGGANGGGDQTFLLGGRSGAIGALKIGGNLIVESQATDPAGHGFSDQFWATDVTVGKSVSIRMGVVDSTVFLDNIFVKGSLDIKTGNGNDTVEIERNGLTGPSMIGRLATIQLGEGNDTLRIGKSSATGSNDYVIFNGGLRADGGPGTDASNDFLNETINVFNKPVAGNGHDDDDDDHSGFDGGRPRFILERINFEGPFLV